MARKSLGKKGKSPIISIRYPKEQIAALETIRKRVKPAPDKPSFYRSILDGFILRNQTNSEKT